LGAAFINAILAPETQTTLAKELSIAPVVQGLELPPNVLQRVDYEAEKQRQLFVSDWQFLNTVRSEWTERWNAIFA
jgi:ABC-type thiamine transport system substrate-binding protein